MATADAPDNPAAANYYNGPPLSYDPQQAQAAPTPAIQTLPQQAAGEQANAPPAEQTPPPPPQDAGDQANHTRVVGVPGYYRTRLNNGNNAAVAPAPAPPAAAAALPPAPVPAAATAAAPPENQLSWIARLVNESIQCDPSIVLCSMIQIICLVKLPFCSRSKSLKRFDSAPLEGQSEQKALIMDSGN
ncbi:hypothetical protein BAE44_0001963 [Dichanthelium oligosanthes]|uniref:Uncharacterized protein n=1 Tax=Dichanthelium oligosanthes TaxID=888268 RepID=A0A1E5WI20_9POAL|nr:hypothetical protein BAE44_0001963 [Dichanthelium oligosanthes]